jgi:hypothetical protein
LWGKDSLRQHILTNSSNNSTGFGFSFIEPITKNLRLQLQQNFDYTASQTERRTYNVDSLIKDEVYDSDYSNEWSAKTLKIHSNLSLLYEKESLYLTIGLTRAQNNSDRVMENNDKIQQKQKNYSPSLVANYKLSKTKSLRFNFSGNYQNPSIEQLQPVPDNSNPLFIRLGNPGLKPSFQQNYNLGYNGFYKEGKTIALSLNYSPVINHIVNAIHFDEFGVRSSQFINVTGIYNIRSNWNFTKVISGPSQAGQSWGTSGNAGFGRSVFFDRNNMLYTRIYNLRQSINFTSRMLKGKQRNNISASLTVQYNRSMSPSNTSGINSKNLGMQPKLDWGFRIKDFIDIITSYSVSYNELNYSGTTLSKQRYADHMASNNLNFQIKKKFTLESNLTYRYNGRLPKGTANREQWLWRMGASVNVFKNQRGLISFSANDLLSNGADITRTIGDNYVEDVQTARQRSYYTLSFQYNWTRMARKKEKTS